MPEAKFQPGRVGTSRDSHIRAAKPMHDVTYDVDSASKAQSHMKRVSSSCNSAFKSNHKRFDYIKASTKEQHDLQYDTPTPQLPEERNNLVKASFKSTETQGDSHIKDALRRVNTDALYDTQNSPTLTRNPASASFRSKGSTERDSYIQAMPKQTGLHYDTPTPRLAEERNNAAKASFKSNHSQADAHIKDALRRVNTDALYDTQNSPTLTRNPASASFRSKGSTERDSYIQAMPKQTGLQYDTNNLYDMSKSPASKASAYPSFVYPSPSGVRSPVQSRAPSMRSPSGAVGNGNGNGV